MCYLQVGRRTDFSENFFAGLESPLHFPAFGKFLYILSARFCFQPALIEAFPVLKPLFPKLLQLRLVVDANRLRGELYWRLKKRGNAANRSALHEVIDVGVVIFFARDHVKWEIEKHYEDIARQARTTTATTTRTSFQPFFFDSLMGRRSEGDHQVQPTPLLRRRRERC